jgi:SpoVK/Ycf46/Vps4 family AAA+-type ATPase
MEKEMESESEDPNEKIIITVAHFNEALEKVGPSVSEEVFCGSIWTYRFRTSCNIWRCNPI